MRNKLYVGVSVAALAFGASAVCGEAFARPLDPDGETSGRIRHVLLVSIDGMHALDLANCSGENGGAVTCPTLKALAKTGLVYTQASTSKPSDSFPGLTALVTGGTPKSTGAFYDVSYDRALSPPTQTTPYGIPGGPDLCPKSWARRSASTRRSTPTTRGWTAAAASTPTSAARSEERLRARLSAQFHPREHDVRGRSGRRRLHRMVGQAPVLRTRQRQQRPGRRRFLCARNQFDPGSAPQVTSMKCSPLPDQTAVPIPTRGRTASRTSSATTASRSRRSSTRSTEGPQRRVHTPVPTLFGMNFQAVSVGEKLVETSTRRPAAIMTPSARLQALANGIVRRCIDRRMVSELKDDTSSTSTTIIITAKHGQSPIDPNRVLRIPADNASKAPPSSLITPAPVQALEDDVSLLWLQNAPPLASRARWRLSRPTPPKSAPTAANSSRVRALR